MAAAKTSKKTNKKTGKKAASTGAAAPKKTRPLAVEREEHLSTDQPRDPAQKKLLGAWIQGLNTDGRVLATFAGQVKGVTDVKRPTGIMPMDIDCGGGFPANRMSLISGPFGAGKSFLLMKTMIMHQRIYGSKSVLGVVVVEPFDYKRALKLGLKIEVPDDIIAEWNEERRLLGQLPYTDEEVKAFKYQIGDIVMMRGENGDEAMGLALKAVKLRMFGIVGIDSLSVMLPAVDENKDVGARNMMASNATLITDFVKKYTPMMNALNERNYTTVIGVNQVRANMEKASAGAMAKYMQDWVTTGAWAMRHLKSIDLQVWNGKKMKRTVNGEEAVIGKEMIWRLDKGKDGTREGKHGTIPFYHEDFYLPGTDDLGSIITEGLRRDVFRINNGKVDVIHPITKQCFDTVPNGLQFQKMMAADFEYELTMRRFVLEAAGVRCLYKQLE